MNEGSFVVMCSTWLNALVDEDDHDYDSDTQESTGLLQRIRANTTLINQLTNELYGIHC